MLTTTLVTALLALLIAFSPSFVQLPYPGHGFVQPCEPTTLANATPIQDVCPVKAVHEQLLLHDAVQCLEELVGVESLAVDRNGDTLALADQYGYLHLAKKVQHSEGVPRGPDYQLDTVVPVYLGSGRPLGLMYDQEGQVIVCDGTKGLLSVDFEERTVQLLTSRVSEDSPTAAGTDVSFANDLDIAASGVIYFSASSEHKLKYNYERRVWDLFEGFFTAVVQGKPSGYLLRYDPAKDSTHVLVDDIWFANGVALSQDEHFVAVAETAGMRVLKHWLKGPKAGQTEILVDKLPGYPDGLQRAQGGGFWVALVAPPLPGATLLPYRLARLLLAWVPAAWRPSVGAWGVVLKVSDDGRVLDCLVDLHGQRVHGISAVAQRGQRLFFGNLLGRGVSYITLPPQGTGTEVQ